MNKVKHITIVIFFCIISLTTTSCSCSAGTDPVGTDLQAQKSQIMYMLGRAGSAFSANITLIEKSDIEGDTYYLGEIDPELDAQLVSLVDAYNADPATKEPINIEDVRYSLTEGISETTLDENWDSPCMLFIRWLGRPADLVDQDGIVITDLGSISNYSYVIGKDGFNNRGVWASYEYSISDEQTGD